ncbi:MAG TPA: hypothetical protein VNB64_03985 [Solirubrobacteraceae bacterium]|nr:hypothetical protein [Solirubrobacteraceae bacterium]
MNAPPPVRPSLTWLGLAGAVAVAGIAGAVILFVLLLRDVDGPFVALSAPVTVQLDEGEGRGIWVTDDGPVRAECSAQGPRVAELESTSGVTVTSGGREYHSFLRFEAPRAGTYRVACAPGDRLALGPRVTGLRIAAGVLGILASFFGGLLGAGLIVAVVLILRERSKRRAETARPPPAPGSPFGG